MVSDRSAPHGRDGSGSAPDTEVDGTSIRPEREEGMARGEALGRYVVLERIGAGGMGVVYAAYDPELDRKVAVKVLRRRRRESGKVEVDRVRMLREAQALARLSHPNVVAVYDAGLHEGRVFLAMDFVEGQDLRKWVEQAAPGWREIVAAYVQAGQGLAAAHAAGLVHRDFKPDNVIRDDSGRVRVLDFGLARASGHTGPARTVSRDDRDAIVQRLHSDRYLSLDTPVTLAGSRLGTPAYMAPEQHLGETTDARTDQFALCVSLHEALYRQLPFQGDSLHALAFATVEGIVQDPPKGSRVPAWLRRVILKGLAAAPDERWPSMEALLAALQRDPSRARRRVAFGAIALAAVMAGGWWYDAARGARQAPCQAATQRVVAAWNPARRGAIDAAFQGTDRSHAARTAQEVGDALDGWAAEWTAAHTDACEATHVRHEQSDALLDLRMGCLSRALDRVDALADRLETADGEVVDLAIEAVRALPPLGPCGDVEALGREPPRAEGADELERALAPAKAAGALGKSREAVELARPVVGRARALGDPLLLAQALLTLGTALETTGEYQESKSILVEANGVAEGTLDVDLLAEIRSTLVLVAGDRLAVPAEGLVWARLAEAALERAGASPSRLARLRNQEAHVYEEAGQPEQALARRREALELMHADAQPDELGLATINSDLATVLADRQELDEAEARATEALELVTRVLGPDHRRTGNTYAVVALVHEARGEYAQALEKSDLALQILTAADGEDAPSVTGVRRNAAIMAIHSGDYERGERDFRRVLESTLATLGPEHPDTATAWGNLAGILRMRGRAEEAEGYARKALALRERVLPPDHPGIAHSIATLANVLEEAGRHAEVVPMRERVLEIYTKVYGAHAPKLLVDYGNLAYSAAKAGQHARAEEAANEAMALAEGADTKNEHAAFARLVLAYALTARGRERERARTLVEEAIERIEGLAAPAERELVEEIARAQGWKDLEDVAAGAAAP